MSALSQHLSPTTQRTLPIECNGTFPWSANILGLGNPDFHLNVQSLAQDIVCRRHTAKAVRICAAIIVGCVVKDHACYLPSLVRVRDWYYPAPLVRVGLDNGRSGITSALGLQPDIPVGSIVTMTRKEFPVTLDVCRDRICANDPNAYERLEIPGSVRVRVLRYDPGPHAFDSLYVKVLSGDYAGRRGWMEPSDMQSADSPYSNLYGLDYSPVPELVPNAT